MLNVLAVSDEPWMFSIKHIQVICVFGGILIAFFVGMYFANKKMNMDKRRLVLQILACTMLALEFVKYINILSNGGLGNGKITPGEFPFLLCSMPLYLYPMVAFSKGKLGQFVSPAAFILGMMGGAIALAYPSAILEVGQPWFLPDRLSFSIISFPYHTLMVMFAGYMLQSKIFKFRIGDLWKAYVVTLGLATIAIILNIVIPTADFFMLGHGLGNPLGFLIDAAGLPVYILVMLSLGCFVIFLLYLYPLIKWAIARKKTKSEATSDDE